MALNDQELTAHLTRVGAMPPAGQRLAMERLTTEELERADLIASGYRIRVGHGENPGGGSDLCGTCGILESSNPRVAFAFHPTVLLQ